MNENQLDETPNTQYSYDEMSEKMKVQNLKRKYFRISLSVLSGILSLFLIFYFTLPVFQGKNVRLTKKGLLEQSDFVTLASLDRYQPLLTLDTKQACFNAENRSCGLILDAEMQNDGFSCKVSLREEAPCGIFDDVIYVSSGKTFSAFLEGLDNLPLSQLRKNVIHSALQEKGEQHLPVLHLSSGETLEENTAKRAFGPINYLPSSFLSRTIGFQYINTSETSNPDYRYNVMDILIEYNGNHFVFKRNLVDKLPLFYSEKTLDKLFPALDDWVKVKQPKKISYSFDDESITYEVYAISVFANDKGVIDFSQYQK